MVTLINVPPASAHQTPQKPKTKACLGEAWVTRGTIQQQTTADGCLQRGGPGKTVRAKHSWWNQRRGGRAARVKSAASLRTRGWAGYQGSSPSRRQRQEGCARAGGGRRLLSFDASTSGRRRLPGKANIPKTEMGPPVPTNGRATPPPTLGAELGEGTGWGVSRALSPK